MSRTRLLSPSPPYSPPWGPWKKRLVASPPPKGVRLSAAFSVKFARLCYNRDTASLHARNDGHSYVRRPYTSSNIRTRAPDPAVAAPQADTPAAPRGGAAPTRPPGAALGGPSALAHAGYCADGLWQDDVALAVGAGPHPHGGAGLLAGARRRRSRPGHVPG